MAGRRKTPLTASGYMRAREAFGCEYEGEMITVAAGELVPKGHPLTKGRDDLFEPVTSLGRWDQPAKADDDEPEVEQATAAPGEKRA